MYQRIRRMGCYSPLPTLPTPRPSPPLDSIVPVLQYQISNRTTSFSCANSICNVVRTTNWSRVSCTHRCACSRCVHARACSWMQFVCADTTADISRCGLDVTRGNKCSITRCRWLLTRSYYRRVTTPWAVPHATHWCIINTGVLNSCIEPSIRQQGAVCFQCVCVCM